MKKKSVILVMVSFLMGYLLGKKSNNNSKTNKTLQKYVSIYNPWFTKYQKGKNIAKIISQKQYRSVAVYGLGNFGVCLINELKINGIKIDYIIDQRAEEIFYRDIDVYEFSDDLPKVDAVIITTVQDVDLIKEKLLKKMDCDVYTLEELLK